VQRPEPAIGFVVRFDYLFEAEAQRGRRDGAKARPCAVVVAHRLTSEGVPIVVLAAITHSAPRMDSDAVEIPYAVKSRLGLDDERSWIVTSEINSVRWDDPGFVPFNDNRWVCGTLPPGLSKQANDRIVENFDRKRLGFVARGPTRGGKA
jgi:hypothetical protein